jgi:hypothetical protein
MTQIRALMIVVGCFLYLSIQIFFIVRAHFVDSKHFAFWMFPESTSFYANLSRETYDGREISTKQGTWVVEDGDHFATYRWADLVNDYNLNVLDRRVRSRGSWADSERYFQEALNFFARRIPEDKQTRRLVLRISVKKAGEKKRLVTLRSEVRDTETREP